ncbi:MAG: hypothetical protein JW779_11575 [Candidatus Thorarchaeota archaeon]|nr:hypothetical protein [Candidatus Thorarchaeota archaeon]
MQFDFWDPFNSFFEIFGLMFVIIPIIFVVIFIVIAVTVCRSGTQIASNVARGFTMEAPPFVIPERHRGQTRSDGSQMTTVRLPERCPSCGAAISQEGIDWVGPLEAKCTYCGSTLRATFERV